MAELQDTEKPLDGNCQHLEKTVEMHVQDDKIQLAKY
jgi:hypothetical protein